MSKIIENIRSFILECPFLQDYRVNVDYLGENMEYSIDPLPCDPIIQKYVDSGAKNSFNLLLPVESDTIRTLASILIIVDFIKNLTNGWKRKASPESCPY